MVASIRHQHFAYYILLLRGLSSTLLKEFWTDMYLYIRELNTPRISVDIEANMFYDTCPPANVDNAMAHGSSS